MSNKIQDSKKFSSSILEKIKNELDEKLDNKKICVVTMGSYARGEASEDSDMDYFVIVKNYESDLSYDEKQIICNTISNHISKNSGDTGTFGDDAFETLENMLKNIGGSEDTNIKITRRMLFLLESKALYNDDFYDEVMDKLINIYVKNIKTEQIARFLLNDIIRYYRTITVDFEFKTNEASKNWGLRNIKLTFSRKLIYFAGLLCVAKTMDLEKPAKITLLKKLFNQAPLERIEDIVSADLKKSIFKLYNNFLEEVSKPDTRKLLNSILTINDERNEVYKKLKKQSKEFSTILIKAMKETFDNKHRIHEAILF